MISIHGKGGHATRGGHGGKGCPQCPYCERMGHTKTVVTLYMAFLTRKKKANISKFAVF